MQNLPSENSQFLYLEDLPCIILLGDWRHCRGVWQWRHHSRILWICLDQISQTVGGDNLKVQRRDGVGWREDLLSCVGKEPLTLIDTVKLQNETPCESLMRRPNRGRLLLARSALQGQYIPVHLELQPLKGVVITRSFSWIQWFGVMASGFGRADCSFSMIGGM